MSGMVFPQTPAPAEAGQASENRASVARDKHGDSEFDSVSRQERDRAERRLDAKRQERADQAEKAQHARAANQPEKPDRADATDNVSEASSANSGHPEDAGTAEHEESTQSVEAGGQAQQPTDQEAGSDPLLAEGEAGVVVFTFADLQSMVMAGESDEPGSAAVTLGGKPGVRPGAAPAVMDGLQGHAGAKSLLPGQTAASLGDGVTLALNADPARSADLSAVRLGGELGAAVSPLSSGAQRPPEQAMMLRGYATSVELPVGHAEWGDKVVGKLTWLTANKMGFAEIHLTPPDMGPMEVRVHVNRDQQATVSVHSANPVVRDQLELHSHRLRDMLSEQGIDLGQFDVADRGAQGGGQWSFQGDGDDAGSGRGGSPALAEDGMSLEADNGTVELTWKGELDLYV